MAKERQISILTKGLRGLLLLAAAVVLVACQESETLLSDDNEQGATAGTTAGTADEDYVLPVVSIMTKDAAAVTSNTEWIGGCTMSIVTYNGSLDLALDSVQIRGRGNTSWWNYPKKSFALKLAERTEVLGMAKHKRWVLLANWMDRTLLRNAVGFEVARQTAALEWTPSGEFVELVLNGDTLGCYYLCEQIRVDKNRLDIAELSADSDDITGGYLLELDYYYDGDCRFRSNYGAGGSAATGMPVNIKYPDADDITDAQLSYIHDHYCMVESLLYADDFPASTDYRNYIDLESFADYWLVNVLVMNGELYWPKSCYMYKDRGGRFKAGPVWDLDYWTFTPDWDTWGIKDCVWYDRLFLDPYFVALVKERWAATRERFLAVTDFIDTTAAQIKASAERNNEQWPITQTVNGDETMTFDEAVARLRQVYLDRIEWIDEHIDNVENEW